ncbi:MAG: hypothetical protein FD170_569 [Bacteroidetes bacterium]|nr:MAG: hypothetical protein FD170_569 [Bacteroidota bacterium]
MKHIRLFLSISLLLSAACTKEIDLNPNPGNENTVITFKVNTTGYPEENTLKIYDNYDYFLSDTLPLIISKEYISYGRGWSKHTLIFPKESNRELWIRVNSLYKFPWFYRDFIYKSSIFIPLTDSLIVDTEYEKWIQE